MIGPGAKPLGPIFVDPGPRGKWRSLPDTEYARLLDAQDGHCALCPSTPKTRRLAVDHDHKTGRVRGLLCHRCNRAVWSGLTGEWARRLAVYLDAAV